MVQVETIERRPPYAVTRTYHGGIQQYVGAIAYCDLIANRVTPETSTALEEQLVAEASAALGTEAQIVDITVSVDLLYDAVVRVFFEPVSAGRPAQHLDRLGRAAGELAAAA